MFHSEDHVMFAGNNSKLYDSHSAVQADEWWGWKRQVM